MEKLTLNLDTYYPMYIGDDITDEDAFESLKNHQLHYDRQGQFHPTSADFVLENTRKLPHYRNTF